jgi:hypothetical protein
MLSKDYGDYALDLHLTRKSCTLHRRIAAGAIRSAGFDLHKFVKGEAFDNEILSRMNAQWRHAAPGKSARQWPALPLLEDRAVGESRRRAMMRDLLSTEQVLTSSSAAQILWNDSVRLSADTTR